TDIGYKKKKRLAKSGKDNPDVFLQNTRMFYPKTWGCFAPLHPDVLGENMGMFWVLTPIL
ncbi:hypothetical protein, partial [Bacteroides uniformis]|uniref:hypothetical protein n=1 Tax=Bacteroides uniformis TaxID=820 RepID=UPI004043D7F3